MSAPAGAPRKWRPTAAVIVLGIGILIVIGLVIAIVFVIRPLVDPSAAPPTAETVLDVAHSDGSAVTESELQTTVAAIEAEIRDAGLDIQAVVARDGAIVVRFSDPAVTASDLSEVVDVIGTSSTVEFRLVQEVEPPADGECAGADAGSSDLIACDLDGYQYRLGPVEMDGSHITSATATELTPADEGEEAQWVVDVEFDAAGTGEFADITAEAAIEQQQFAFVVDGVVISAPQVMAEITDGNPQISGDFDRTAAESLAGRLTLASLGIELTVRSSTLFLELGS